MYVLGKQIGSRRKREETKVMIKTSWKSTIKVISN